MSPFIRTALCPVAANSGTGAPPAPYLRPRPDGGLALSLTVPCVPRSAGIVRTAFGCALRAHELDRYVPPAVLAVTELIATATRLDASDAAEDLYLSLRHRDDVLRLVVWDQHPRHADPDAVAVCEERRRRSLWLLAAVVEDWGGDWGVGDARPPHRGIKSWVVLPR